MMNEKYIFYLKDKIIKWYANHDNWVNKSDRQARAVVDSGRYADKVSNACSFGALLMIICDAYEISIIELANESGIDQSRMSSLILNNDISSVEFSNIKLAIEKLS